jgi:hypothetical protein
MESRVSALRMQQQYYCCTLWQLQNIMFAPASETSMAPYTSYLRYCEHTGPQCSSQQLVQGWCGPVAAAVGAGGQIGYMTYGTSPKWVSGLQD